MTDSKEKAQNPEEDWREKLTPEQYQVTRQAGTEPFAEALDYIDEVAARPEMHVQFRQEAGDILLLNNWITYHRREAFEDHSDLALRRHLLRIWLSVPNSRPLDPRFRENYGAVEAGAIRGGMKPA